MDAVSTTHGLRNVRGRPPSALAIASRPLTSAEVSLSPRAAQAAAAKRRSKPPTVLVPTTTSKFREWATPVTAILAVTIMATAVTSLKSVPAPTTALTTKRSATTASTALAKGAVDASAAQRVTPTALAMRCTIRRDAPLRGSTMRRKTQTITTAMISTKINILIVITTMRTAVTITANSL